ncbi:small ribosomal subunit protein bS18m isoform X1 [Cynoglossus semilaevis]|uniref:small ribosomal subunit protein bS18m isoform X1 n=1 Tax=Cynoglossus semilaevis TaxID=244447 RepID=UPI000496711D|nr:28S ribosomal protein S18c, mitochondrial isoform X1 [Cynoglossus semilaevis]
MFCRRLSQRLLSVLFQQGNTGLRRETSNVVRHEEGVLEKMTNPYQEPEKGCVLCKVEVDFKNIQLLSQFISPYTGRIYGRHITGLCGRKQKEISKAIKKAQKLGFMSVTHKHPQLMRDPNICNIKYLR